MTDREIDTMNTSSIDLVCCALGGLLLIMLFVATLVRERAEQAALDPEPAEEQPADAGKGFRGREAVPPSPLVVTLEWSGKPRHPLQLTAYPPQIKGGKPSPQDEYPLAEANGSSRPPGGGSYVGFFDRKADEDGGRLRLVIPRGARPGQADPMWRFDVDYQPIVGPTSRLGKDPKAELDRAFEELSKWAGAGQPAWNPGPAPATAATAAADPADRAGRIESLCRSAVIPILNGAAAAPAATQAERHLQALAIVRGIDRALTQADDEWPDDRLQWSDLYGPIDRALLGSGDWLARVYRYAAVYQGTDPGSAERITCRVTVETYKPYSSTALRHGGRDEVEIGPEAAKTKRFDYPPP